MKYGIGELSKLAGVSARTLRYYDEIGLLKPSEVNEAGYRFYGENELILLQQILFYRERGLELEQIRHILYQDDFDVLYALKEHLLELEKQKRYIDGLIRIVEQTIRSMKGECKMTDAEKFEAFKVERLRENEEKYGEEIRERFGDGAVEDSNRKMMNMSKKDWDKYKELEAEICSRLEQGVHDGIMADSREGGKIAALHKEWLGMTWKEYSVQAHEGLACMYTEDERFKSYYDRHIEGCALLLKEIIDYWAKRI